MRGQKNKVLFALEDFTLREGGAAHLGGAGMSENFIETKEDSDSLDPSEENLDFDIAADAEPLEEPEPVILGQKDVCFCWRLICPPENWQEPIPIEAGEVRLLELLSRRLNLFSGICWALFRNYK